MLLRYEIRLIIVKNYNKTITNKDLSDIEVGRLAALKMLYS